MGSGCCCPQGWWLSCSVQVSAQLHCLEVSCAQPMSCKLWMAWKVKAETNSVSKACDFHSVFLVLRGCQGPLKSWGLMLWSLAPNIKDSIDNYPKVKKVKSNQLKSLFRWEPVPLAVHSMRSVRAEKVWNVEQLYLTSVKNWDETIATGSDVRELLTFIRKLLREWWNMGCNVLA